jgi:hypothetical protein
MCRAPNDFHTAKLVESLQGYTARLQEIIDTKPDYPVVRAKVIAGSALIALWAHSPDGPLKDAIFALEMTLNTIH